MCSRRHRQFVVGCVFTLIVFPLYAVASDDSWEESGSASAESSSTESDGESRADPEDVTQPREALQYQLDSDQNYDSVRNFRVRQSGELGAWTFYSVLTVGMIRFPSPNYFAVVDGEIVNDSSSRQLERILESTELLESDELPARDLSTVLKYTVNGGDAPIGSFDSAWIDGSYRHRFPDIDIQSPELEETDDGWTIRYYTHHRPQGGCPPPPTRLRRYQVDVSSDYSVDIDRETVGTDQLGDSGPDVEPEEFPSPLY